MIFLKHWRANDVENPVKTSFFSCYDGVAPQLFLFAKDSGLFFHHVKRDFHFFLF